MAICDVVARSAAPEATALAPPCVLFGGGPQPDGVVTSGGDICSIVHGGGSLGPQTISGTTPPVPKGLGTESFQRFLQATASQRHLRQVMPPDKAPPRL